MTVSATTDFTTVLDDLKVTYGKDLEDFRPNFTVLQELLPANRDGIEMGQTINLPVALSHQGGESYMTSGSTSNLRNPVSMEIKDAKSDQWEVTLPVKMPFGLISKAGQSPKARFGDKAKLILLAGVKGAKRALELSLLHGSNGLGQVASVGSVTGSGPWTLAVTFTAASWSDGIWGGADNLPFDFYSALSAGTKRNTNDISVSAVNFATRTVTFTAQTASTDLSGIAANDYVFSSSGYGNQMAGLMNIIQTTSGSLFQIPTSYSLWKAKQATVSGPLTFGKLLSGISPAVSHGADGKLTCLTSTRNWADLMKDLASARRLDYSYKEKELKNGAQAISFEYAGGLIDVVLHPFMKDGETAVVPVENYFRVGSDPDPTMKLADLNLQVMSGTSNVFEFRFWCASTIIPNMLATSVSFSGITPNAS